MLRQFAVWAATVLACGFVFVAIGCQPTEEPAPAAAETPKVVDSEETDTADDLKSSWAKTLDAAKRLAGEKGDQLMETVESKLSDYDTDMATMEDKAQELGEDGMARWRELKPELEQKRAALLDKIKEIKQAGPGKWLEMKDELEQAWNDMRQAFSKAKESFQVD